VSLSQWGHAPLRFGRATPGRHGPGREWPQWRLQVLFDPDRQILHAPRGASSLEPEHHRDDLRLSVAAGGAGGARRPARWPAGQL